MAGTSTASSSAWSADPILPEDSKSGAVAASLRRATGSAPPVVVSRSVPPRSPLVGDATAPLAAVAVVSPRTTCLLTAAAERPMTLVHVFAGKQRHGDLAACWVAEAAAIGLPTRVIEYDILRSSQHDLTCTHAQDCCLVAIASADALVCGPPCCTFSRAPWSNN